MAFMLEELIAEDFGLVNPFGRFSKSKVHNSLVLDRQKKIFYWNSREIIGDAYVYLTKVRGMSDKDARNYAKNHYEYIFEHGTPVPLRQDAIERHVIPYPALVDLFYEQGKNEDIRSYWYDKRGYTTETIDKWKLGFTGEWYTIPVYDEGNFVNFQLRKEVPKAVSYWYRGVGPHPFNFSILNLTSWIVITEGPPDCIMLRQNLIPSVSHTGGSGYWNVQWNKKFMKMKQVYIVYDNDEAGKNGAKRIGQWLGYKAKIFNFFNSPLEKYDVTDFFKDGGTREGFMELITNYSKYWYEI